MEVIVSIRWNLPMKAAREGLVEGIRARPDWHDRRLELWKRYAMPSLLRQTYCGFEVWLHCDPKEKAQNAQLGEVLTDLRFKIVTDWGKHIREFCSKGKPEDPVLFCRMDSDDMYDRFLISHFCDSVDAMRRAGKEYIQPSQGYALNLQNMKIYRWVNPSPAFFAAPLKRQQAMHMAGGRHICHHGRVCEAAYPLNDRPLFCVTLHEHNVCNSPNIGWVKEEIAAAELANARTEYRISAQN
jgi:hypothetical protein